MRQRSRDNRVGRKRRNEIESVDAGKVADLSPYFVATAPQLLCNPSTRIEFKKANCQRYADVYR